MRSGNKYSPSRSCPCAEGIMKSLEYYTENKTETSSSAPTTPMLTPSLPIAFVKYRLESDIENVETSPYFIPLRILIVATCDIDHEFVIVFLLWRDPLGLPLLKGLLGLLDLLLTQVLHPRAVHGHLLLELLVARLPYGQ